MKRVPHWKMLITAILLVLISGKWKNHKLSSIIKQPFPGCDGVRKQKRNLGSIEADATLQSADYKVRDLIIQKYALRKYLMVPQSAEIKVEKTDIYLSMYFKCSVTLVLVRTVAELHNALLVVFCLVNIIWSSRQWMSPRELETSDSQM